MRTSLLLVMVVVASISATAVAPMDARADRQGSGQATSPPSPSHPGGEVQFSPDEVKEYYAVYKRPEVKYLRTVLNAYLAGKPRTDTAYDALRNFDKDYYRSKFIVITIVTPSGGGSLLTLMFQDRPDALFKAWVWMEPMGLKKQQLELRQFERAEVGPESIAALRKKYRRLLNDKAHAM
jgi:hypothetical protein